MGDHADTTLPEFGSEICIVLVDPEHDGNIGAVARSMMNFGIIDLRVVGRSTDWSEDTRRRAKNAQYVLEHAREFQNLQEATSDCSLVVGTSGKREHGDKTSMRHFLLPEELPERLSGIQGKSALVFGPEGKGLLNEQLRLCDLLVTIPTWEGYPILNLSHAVTILCFSWFSKTSNSITPGTKGRLLDPDLRRRLREEATRLVQSMPTKEHKRQGMEETLVRVIMRGLPKDDEIHRILGILSASADSFENSES
ncbi:MAG: RNA methyltransferase [Candidatus Thermoplasmatota archaeon]|nr:RNA methyltransferase [Candidatus Thermoplasmatota archaeon]